MISCDSGFHGVTLGPLSLVGDEFLKEGFGPPLPGCERVPFGDLSRLEAELRAKDVAAFIVEPIQGRSVTLPPEGYLQAAQALCRRYGTLFVIDEVQTGLGRTGKWFALEHWGLEPDFVLLGKALSGGYMPVAAMVTSREIYENAVGTLERCYVHQSTFGRNRLSMAAGLATLRIIERDRLIEHAAHLIHMASEGLFPQLIVIPLHRDHGVITMAAGKNDVIKLLPPLTLSEPEARSFLGALDAVLADCQGAAGNNWPIVRDIATATLLRRGRHDVEVMDQASFRGTSVDPSRNDVCLITGATGFIGGHLTQRLVQEGHQVRCLVRASSDTSRLEELDVEIAVGDLTRSRSLRRAAKDCRYVFHCGAFVSDWATAEEIARTNVTGTRNLLKASVDASVQRFIHFSSTDIYGYPGGAAIDETHTATRFANWYAQTKLAAEAEVCRAEQVHALNTVILRPATVYGPRSTEVIGDIAAGDSRRQDASR